MSGAERASAPLCLTLGDPAGIGPEITLAAWQALRADPAHAFYVIGPPALFTARVKQLGLSLPVTAITSAGDAVAAFADALPVMVCTRAPDQPVDAITPGKPDPHYAPLVIGAIDQAVDDVTSRRAAAIVTNPISKSVLYGAGFRHPGHTEYLAHLATPFTANARTPHPVMMLADEAFRVVPATVHIPLADVPAALTSELLERVCRITLAELQLSFACPAPRLAVAGLNPHAGEHGSIGREDLEVIGPVVTKLRAEGLDVRGPLPADTMFHDRARAGYDAAIAMYHDQALIPIKTIAFDHAVNITLGLPFVRTSPDHGTAFDISGKGIARPDSLIAAIKAARRIAGNRAHAQKPSTSAKAS